MSVSNGQPINAAVTNAAFVSKITDSTVVSKVTLNKSGSGTQVVDTQQTINKVLDVIGTTEVDALPNDYANSNFITDGDNRKVAIEKLDAQLKTTDDNVNTAISDIGAHDTRLDNLETNTMTISGDKTFADSVVIQGDLTVEGTTYSESQLEVTDTNITVNKSGSNLTSEGSGLTVDRVGTKGSLIYKDTSPTKFAIGPLASEINVVDESTAQTLSNKNYPYSDYLEQGSDPSAPAATYRRIYSKADGFYQRDSSGAISKVGTGSGSGGGINFITDGDADAAIATIFVPYQDSSGTRPTDGTGGTTTGITTALTSSAPLSGSNSFTLTKDAANRQGGGWTIPFTVPIGFFAKACKINVQYIVNSGTFVAGSSTTESDVIWYLYDVTNSTLIEPSNIKMFSNNASIADNYQAEFQTSATGTSYRLIAHIQSTSASAYELKVDNISVGPSEYVYGSTDTDWQPYTPTYTGFGTVTTVDAFWKREGDSIYIKGRFISGTTTAVAAQIGFPSGLSVSTQQTTQSVAEGTIVNNMFTTVFAPLVSAGDSGIGAGNVASSGLVKVTGTGLAAATNPVGYSVGPIPIQGWATNGRISDGYDAREISSTILASGSQSLTNATFTKIQLTNKLEDLTASFDNVTNYRYVIPTSGRFKISGSVAFAANATGSRIASYRVNGGSDIYLNVTIAAPATGESLLPISSETVSLKAGDYIEFFAYQQSGGALTLTTNTRVTISKNQAPTTISANELLYADYSSTAGNSVGTSDTLQIYGTKVEDTHGAYNSGTGIFTAPTSGNYRASVTLLTAAVTLGTTQTAAISLYKNGSFYRRLSTEVGSGGSASVGLSGNIIIPLKAGDTLSIYAISAVATTQSSTAGHNFLTIERLK